MATAVTAWGRTAAGEHKALNAQITPLPTDFAKLELNLSFTLTTFSWALKRKKRVSTAGSLVEKLLLYCSTFSLIMSLNVTEGCAVLQKLEDPTFFLVV